MEFQVCLGDNNANFCSVYCEADFDDCMDRLMDQRSLRLRSPLLRSSTCQVKKPSQSIMNRIQLRPSVQHLAEGDPHLPELMRYINWLLEGNDQQRTAHNASLLYFALVKGFAENDLIRASWAPRMVIDVGDLEFEVGCLLGFCTEPV